MSEENTDVTSDWAHHVGEKTGLVDSCTKNIEVTNNTLRKKKALLDT